MHIYIGKEIRAIDSLGTKNDTLKKYLGPKKVKKPLIYHTASMKPFSRLEHNHQICHTNLPNFAQI